jgi:hypothetical protein
MTRFRLLVVLTGITAVMASAPAPAGAAKGRKQVRLHAFSSCTSLVSYGTRHMASVVSPMRGAPVPVAAPPAGAAPGGSDGRPAPVAQDAPAAPGAGQDFSQTNVQEAGVDEPDTVKTDGRTLFVLRGGVLYAIDARSAAPTELGNVKLSEGYGHTMLLHDGRALVVSTEAGAVMPIEGGAASTMIAPDWQPKTVISEVDVRDPGSMKVLRTLTVDGSFVNARLNGRTARLVVLSTPEAIARQTSRRAARRLARWLPSYTMRRAGSRHRSRARAVSCRSVRRPSQFSGLDVMTVLTIDLAKGLPAIDADALMTSADTVYGSGGSLYVATRRYIRALEQGMPGDVAVPENLTTAIHRFDISDPDKTVYRSSGEVPGFLLSQWAMSEDKGVLRVASTSQPTWWGGATTTPSESFVTVLDDKGAGALARVGQVGGLGKGEQIHAVRFIGDLGYVVTFRQTDPLYVVDVSNPARPRVAGELKILGYSAYLHPAGPDLLIGIGQDATEQGRRLGAQVSLFDVSDPAHPTRIQARQLGSGSSTETEWDHHAFLWWPQSDLAVIPLERYSETNPFTGAVGLKITRRGIAEAGRLEHPVAKDWMGRITRSVVVGERLFTISDAGVEASRLSDLRDDGWVAFPPAPGA